MAAVGADLTAAALIPDRPSLSRLREAAAGCRACELWRKGTQTVFGEGSPDASVMLVGEQPGDREDLSGHPFVGPAGGLLDRALEKAGIPRGDAYLTNVVKHFNWEARGKRRIHRKPNPEPHPRVPALARRGDQAGGPGGPGPAGGDRRPGGPRHRLQGHRAP